MKHLITIMLFSLTCFASENAFETKHSENIAAITSARTGLSEKEVSSVKDMFEGQNLVVATAATENKSGYNLSAICGSKAKIDGIWYKVGDEIDGYTLNSVGFKGAVLKTDSQTLNLNLSKGSYNVIISK